jgi:hypothetical protein
MPLHLYYSIFYLCIRKEIYGDQFSSLIVRMRVLHAAGTPGGYVEDFGEKSFSFWVELFFLVSENESPPLSSNLLACQVGLFLKSIVDLILIRKISTVLISIV